MTDQTAYIVSTRKLDTGLKSRARQYGFRLQDMEMVSVRHCDIDLQGIAGKMADAPGVFTSRHAVESVMHNIERHNMGRLRWRSYCIAGNTSRTASEYGFTVIATADDGASLAEKIVADKVRHVVHFTSNIRRPELAAILHAAHVVRDEIIVYEKHLTPEDAGTFDGVLFFSPSQVESFLLKNILPENVPAFCIGDTTARSLRDHGHTLMLIAGTHDAEAVVELAIEYFRNKR